MKRLIQASAAAAAVLLQMTSPAPAQTPPTTIVFSASMLGEPQRGPLLTAVVDEFNRTHPNIVVKTSSTPFSSFGATTFTQIGGGAGADVIAFDQQNIYAAVANHLVLPIDDIVKGIELLPGNNSLKVNGVQYATALDLGNYALIYNPDLVKKVPTNMDELLAEAKAQTKNGVYGYAFRHTRAEAAGVWYDLSNFVYGYGGNWSKDGVPTINSPETVAGITEFKKFYDSGVIPKGADAATYRRMFANGKIAMMIDNGGIPTVLAGTNPDIKIGAAVPPFPTQHIGQVMAALAINANSKNPEAAKTFLKWFLGNGPQAQVQEFLGGSTPATRQPRTAKDLAAHPYAPVYDSRTPFAMPFIPPGMEALTPQIRDIVVEEVLAALQGQKDVKAALDAAQTKVLALKR